MKCLLLYQLKQRVGCILTALLLLDLSTPVGAQTPSWLKAGDTWDAATKTLTVNSNPVDSAYFGIRAFKRLILGADVTSVGKKAFAFCQHVDELYVFSNCAYDGRDSIFYATFFKKSYATIKWWGPVQNTLYTITPPDDFMVSAPVITYGGTDYYADRSWVTLTYSGSKQLKSVYFKPQNEVSYITNDHAIKATGKDNEWLFRMRDYNVDFKAEYNSIVPKILAVERKYTINENSAKGTVAGTFTVDYKAKDATTGNYEALTYTLGGKFANGTDVAEVFELEETNNTQGVRTVALKVKNTTKLDYETLYKADKRKAIAEKVRITVTATNSHTDANTQIEVSDVYESFSAKGGTFYIMEHSPGGSSVSAEYEPQAGTEIPDSRRDGMVKADAVDIYAAPARNITFSISPNNHGQQVTDAAKFTVDAHTGIIRTAKGAEFDYATSPKQYSFLVKADDGKNSKDVAVTVKLQDMNEPDFLQYTLGEGYIREDAAVGDYADKFSREKIQDAELLAQFDALGEITGYEMAGASGQHVDDIFGVNPTNGWIYVKEFIYLDYEALYPRNVFTINIKAKNAADQSVLISRTVTVVDVNERPVIKDQTFNINEGYQSTTAIIGKVKAIDPDSCSVVWSYRCAPGNHTYGFNKLHYVIEDAPADLPFEIDSQTGELLVIQGKALSYAKQNKYEFTVRVFDYPIDPWESSRSASAQITVNVKDVDNCPQFASDIPVLTVNENTQKGHVVGCVEAIDEDCLNGGSGKKPTYTLVAADDVPDDYKAFTIDNDGIIKVAKDDILNYEKQSVYDVRVVATDGNDAMLTASIDVSIYVNDINDAPTYEEKEYVLDLDENSAVGTYVGSVVADDEDTWSSFSYSLLDYVAGSHDSDAFRIDEEGKVFVVTNNLNFEKNKQYQMWVKATDNGEEKGFDSKHAMSLITINLTDRPDAPAFGEVTAIYEVDDGAVGKEIDVIELKDDDAYQAATLLCYLSNKDWPATVKAEDFLDVHLIKVGGSYPLSIVFMQKADYIKCFNPDKNDAIFDVVLTIQDADDLASSAETTIKVNIHPAVITFADNQKWLTYYDAEKNCLVPDGVKAYVVTDAENGVAKIRQVSYLKKGVPLLLEKSAGATSTFDYQESFADNLLKYASSEVANSDKLYVLYNGEFIHSSNNIQAGKRYLDLSGKAALTRSYIIGDGTTGLDVIDNAQPGVDNWYDLQGRRMAKPTQKGLYIKNGEKVVIK